MAEHALVTAVGADRVGIVDDISREILDRACNIEESRMALLGGDFAVLMLVSGPAAEIAALIGAANAVGEKLGLSVQIRATVPSRGSEGTLPYVLESSSLDSPGIVHAVAAVLRKAGINIADMETDTESAPLTGAPLFTLRARLLIPRNLSVPALRRELEALEVQYNLDLRLSPLT